MFTICLLSFIPHFSLSSIVISMCFASLWSFIYIFNKATDLKEDTINISGLPIKQSLYRKIVISSHLFLLWPILVLVFWPKILFFYAVLAVIFGYMYSFPFRINGGVFRLKKIFFIKNFVAALCWASVPTVLPSLYFDMNIHPSNLITGISYFVFIFAIEVVWDIRDIDGDRAVGIKTLPNSLGIKQSKIICLIPVLSMLIYQYMNMVIHPIFSAAYILTIITILLAKKNSHPYVFQGIVMIWILANISFLINVYM